MAQQTGTGEYYTATSYAIGLTYARNMTNRFAFGGTFPFTEIKLPNTAWEYGAAPEGHQPLLNHINELKGEQTSSFSESLMNMFSKGYPEGIDPNLVNKGMADWQNYWVFPAGMAAMVLVIFGLAFWDKVKTTEEKSASDAQESA